MPTKTPVKKATKKAATKKAAAKEAALKFPGAPLVAPTGPSKYRIRVRMYRHGLGDCFLLTFRRKSRPPFQLLIDCGVLARDAEFMQGVVGHIRDTVKAESKGKKAKLDAVAATHEHKDHLSGFNQARDIFNNDFEFGSVWLGWTENLTKKEILKIKEAKKKAVAALQSALTSDRLAGRASLNGVAEILGFTGADDVTGSAKIAEALEYLKKRGEDAGDLRYLEPGQQPFALDGVDGVLVYVLGPPKDPLLLKGSEVTAQMKTDGTIYHLSAAGEAGIDALAAAAGLDTVSGSGEKHHPFSEEHRIKRESGSFPLIQQFVSKTYDDATQDWRKIDDNWTSGFGQLALDLDNDTNNTSLVLAFEFVKTGEVLLFVGDAQVGNWKSWEKVTFDVPGRAKPLPAHDLLERTVFYKVGHHCSHNATLRNGGLELMNHKDLVAFIPLDKETASKQGAVKKDGTKGWDMPAEPLFKALRKKTAERVVLSDVSDELNNAAKKAGVIATDAYIDYFLK